VDPATGEYVFDAYGDRWSRLTFLVYLNDGFEGGCTTYYTPSRFGGQARAASPRGGGKGMSCNCMGFCVLHDGACQWDGLAAPICFSYGSLAATKSCEGLLHH
jgi:hypothetical protein